MNYTVTLKDGKKIVVSEENTPQADTERAMAGRTPVRLSGIPVDGSMIAYVEPGDTVSRAYGPHLAQGDFDTATKILEARRGPESPAVKSIKAEIREKLSKVDPREINKREYLEAVAEKRRREQEQSKGGA